MTKDITYCAADDCPSTECRIKITNNHFEAGEIISMADFAGVCRFYIGWVLSKIEEGVVLKLGGMESGCEYWDSESRFCSLHRPAAEPRYCDRNICTKNEYNGISCDECEVAKYHNLEDDDSPYMNCEEGE